ncbi:light harvesting protein [Emiliania huxleyi CCMP1516]|uniref:Light harvesting protein n=2 Tax=Emiliania huxleyi TaxID=2903 RepID=A0A0D3JI90_EMIH1|nr:light harvesting protein [Emiliania huxleyi CCMP1516]EOD23225.1 light harvesting protein [Emiliania huxleyi CCMP1516]|eukprot:XP_005775654.1 light harvesting protein [Emiliania huxleyi CCMP1516]
MVSALISPRAGVRATVALDLSRPDRYMYDNPYAPEGMGREYINEPNVRRPLADYELNLGAYFAGETKFEPWDPLGLCLLSKVSANNPDVAFFREAELKHGRMAMLAFVGIVVTTGGKHWPAEAFAQATAAGWPDSLGTLAKTNPGIVAQGLATVGIIEGASNTNRGAWWDGLWFGERPDSPVVAGDLGFDPLGVMPKDPKAADLMRLKELKNGRLAMLGVFGLFMQPHS